MLKKIRDYIVDDKLMIKILENEINIINLVDLVSIEDKKIIILTKDKKIIIRGNNLVISKLLENEVLIYGDINSLELE